MYYTMKKYTWNADLGEYSNVEKRTGPLTLEQVTARVARLPDTTRHFWHIDAYREFVNDWNRLETRHCGGINADEFEDDVPEFSEFC